jgi:hypothetical protein
MEFGWSRLLRCWHDEPTSAADFLPAATPLASKPSPRSLGAPPRAGPVVRGGDRLRRLSLGEPRLVALRSRDRAEAARLLAALMRDAALGTSSGYGSPKQQPGSAADLPMGPSSNGKRRTRKSAGEAA